MFLGAPCGAGGGQRAAAGAHALEAAVASAPRTRRCRAQAQTRADADGIDIVEVQAAGDGRAVRHCACGAVGAGRACRERSEARSGGLGCRRRGCDGGGVAGEGALHSRQPGPPLTSHARARSRFARRWRRCVTSAVSAKLWVSIPAPALPLCAPRPPLGRTPWRTCVRGTRRTSRRCARGSTDG
jgi:hypothetical protein